MNTNPYLEKASSLAIGAAATHLAQNVATNSALHNKHVAKYLANSFSSGVKGVVDKSFKANAVRAGLSVVAPDISAAHKAAHSAGVEMRDLLSKATKKQKVGIRMLTQGRVEDLKKHRLLNDEVLHKAHKVMSKHLPGLPSIDSLAHDSRKVKQLWADKSHPLLSNISKNISRGKAASGRKAVPGKLSQKLPVAASLASGVLDPAAGVINTTKALSLSDKINSTKAGRKVTGFLHKQFLSKPVDSGMRGSFKEGAKHEAYKYMVNPLSAHLKRTSNALSEVKLVSDGYKASKAKG